MTVHRVSTEGVTLFSGSRLRSYSKGVYNMKGEHPSTSHHWPPTTTRHARPAFHHPARHWRSHHAHVHATPPYLEQAWRRAGGTAREKEPQGRRAQRPQCTPRSAGPNTNAPRLGHTNNNKHNTCSLSTVTLAFAMAAAAKAMHFATPPLRPAPRSLRSGRI